MIALLWLVPSAIGVGIGLTAFLARRLPFVLAGIPVLAYIAYVAWLGIRVAACPHCDAGDGDRLYYFPLLTGLYGIFLGLFLLGVALSTRAVRILSKRSRSAQRP